MNREQLEKRIEDLSPWFHYFEIDEVVTKTKSIATEPLRYPEKLFKAQIDYWPYLMNKRCLDIGCNAGFFSVEMAKQGGVVRGVDICQDNNYDAIKQAKFVAKCLSLDIEYLMTDFMNLIESQFYDLVLFLGVYYHLKQPDFAWLKLSSLIKKGGHVIVEGATAKKSRRYDDEELYDGDPTNYFVGTPEYILDSLTTNGFAIEEIIPYSRFMVKAIKR